MSIVRLTINLDYVLNAASVKNTVRTAVVKNYFAGEINAYGACQFLKCDRREWNSMISSIVALVVLSQYGLLHGDPRFGSVEVIFGEVQSNAT